MSAKVWIEISISAKTVWETNFTWITRIMRITFLYPFQKRSIQIIGNIFLSLYLLTSLVLMILKIVKITRENNKLNVTMVECIFQIICFSMMIFCYLRMVVCKKKIYTWSVMIIRMCHTNSQVTQAIMFQTMKKGYHISTFIAGLTVILCISFGASPVVIPSFLNWALPGNQTHEKSLPIHTESFLSEEKFFYQILSVQLIALFIYSLLMSAMNAFQFIGVAYVVGEIRVLEYLLHKMKSQYKFKILDDKNEGKKWIFEQLQDFVEIHKICIELFNVVQDVSNIMIFVVLIGASCTIILTTTSMVILMETDISAAAKMLFAFCVIISTITLTCIPSQLLKNASDDLFYTCYETNLQSYPVEVRKMLLFIMFRSMKPFVLTAGPTIELNLETCSTIIKSSMSYAAAFRSFYTSL